jgi:hypothetical protein
MDKYKQDGTMEYLQYSFINNNTMGMYFENGLLSLLIILQEECL